jgi:hypothetical protein
VNYRGFRMDLGGHRFFSLGLGDGLVAEICRSTGASAEASASGSPTGRDTATWTSPRRVPAISRIPTG